MRLPLGPVSDAIAAVGSVAAILLLPVPGLSQPREAPRAVGGEADIACAPRLSTSPPDTTLTIVGSQEGTTKLYYGPSDTLVIGAGHTQGIDAGQEYFVRRVVSLGRLGNNAPLVLHTAGWGVRIIAAERGCGPGARRARL